MTEKEQYQDNIRWAQALNCAVEVLNPIMRRGQAKTEAEMKQAITFWREWFYNELLKPSPSEVFGEVPVGNPIPKFDFNPTKGLSEDQYKGFGYPRKKISRSETIANLEVAADEHEDRGFNFSAGNMRDQAKKLGKKIDLRGEPKSRDVGRDDAERDVVQEI